MIAEFKDIIAPTGTEISCKGWIQEAAMRMLMNNLHPDVAENPAELIVYGGKGKAARNWDAYEAIINSLKNLETYETFAEAAKKYFGGSLKGKFVLTAGLGGMGGAQPLAATFNGAAFLGVEVDRARIQKRIDTGYIDIITDDQIGRASC